MRRPASTGARTSGADAGAPDRFDLHAKTAIPAVRAGTVPRPGLVNRLRAANGHRLVTLVAPAGYGKTTLLSQWAERDGRRFAWVALDGGDDASTVLECVTAALSHDGSIEADEAHRPGRRPRSSRAARLSSLLNGLPEPVVLVVDDVQAVRSSSSAAVLATLILHMPSGSTLVLSGRELPELPIARLRADREVFELGSDDLALGRRDAHLLLRGVQPELEAVATELWERTEGWAAGLHLAGLVLRDGPGHRRPVEEFTGEDRFVVDYFRLEHLSQLDKLCFFGCSEYNDLKRAISEHEAKTAKQ